MAAVAPPGSAPSKALAKQSVPPNQSLYLHNLPDKLQKDDLKRALYMLFSTYGPVVDINAVKSAKMRGQAHVLFKDVQTATQAMQQCQGFEFFGKEMVRINGIEHRRESSTDEGATEDQLFEEPIRHPRKAHWHFQPTCNCHRTAQASNAASQQLCTASRSGSTERAARSGQWPTTSTRSTCKGQWRCFHPQSAAG